MRKTSRKQIVRLLKSLVRKPRLVRLLQDPESLTKHLNFAPEQQEKVEAALCYLSKQEPKFISTYILEPFVYEFGDFCKKHPLQKRWPNFEELGLAFKHLTSSFLSESYITKRTKYYTLRQIVRDIPAWNEACKFKQKGPIADRQKTHYKENLSDLIDEYLAYLEEDAHLQTSQFRLFAEFFLTLCKVNDIPVNPSLTIEVIKKFEKLNED